MGLLNKQVTPPSTDKWVAFDFDGTIAETSSTLIGFYNEYIAKKHKIRTLSLQDLDTLKDMSTAEKLTFMNIPFYKFPFVIGSARKFFPQIMQQLPVTKGLKDALTQLKMRGYKLAILSSNKTSNIEEYLVEHHLQSLFSYISCDKGRSLFVKHKTLKNFVKEMHISYENFVYIGDETRDVIACNKAGVTPISVSWGWDSHRVLKLSNPDRVVATPSELVEIVTQHLGL